MNTATHRLVIDGARLRARDAERLGVNRRDLVSVVIHDERVFSIAPGAPPEVEGERRLDAAGGLVLPAFVNAHLHLDKALIGAALRPARFASLGQLTEVDRRQRSTYTLPDIQARALTVLESAIVAGTCAVRAFVDAEPDNGDLATRALVELRERCAGELALQVCALPQETLFGVHGGVDALSACLDAGADVVGGHPSGERTTAQMRRHVDVCLALAGERELPVHMLLDDGDSPNRRSLEYLAAQVITLGMQGRVTVSRAGALSAYDPDHAASVIDLVREAGITVCVSPHAALALRGRLDRGAIRRGTPRTRELLTAGVRVVFAQDHVDDPYYPLGRADQLEVGQYAAHVDQLLWPAELEIVLDGLTDLPAAALGLRDYGLRPGARADLVVLPVESVLKAFRLLPPRRYVVLGGRVAAQSELTAQRTTRART